MSINFLLKRSTTASKRPTAAQLDIGELSLNYDAGTAGVFFEDSAGAVRKIGPAEVSATAPNASPAGSSGNSSGELWYDTSVGNLKIFDGTSFVDVSAAGAAGGSDTQVQFNSTGSLAGSANFTFNGTTASIAGLSILGTSRFGLAATQDAIELLGRNGGTSSFRVALRPATLSANRTQDLQNLGGVVALDVNKLNFFAATTSAELAGVISDETGSGALVFATSPTLVTPAIGVATGTSFNGITGLSSTNPAALGTVAVGTGTTVARADHVHPTTGLGLTSGTLAQFAATTSAQLAGVISDETGSGLLVFNTSPSLTTPAIGAATGTSLVLTGSNTASSFIPTGSSVPTNGVYLPAANSVAISTNSSERLRILSDGKLGLGTSSPIYLAHLSSSAITEVGFTATGTGGREWRVGTGDSSTGLNGGFRFFDVTASATRLFINSSGSVGIGTATPGYTLDVVPGSAGDAIRIRGGSGGTGLLQFTDSAASAQWGVITTTSASLDTGHASVVRFSTANSERLRITSAGFVGIGTSTPPNFLTVEGTILGRNTERLAFNTYTNDTSHAGYFGRNTSTAALEIASQNIGANYPINLITANTTRLHVGSTGLIGIGTTSPGSLLDVVNGVARIRTGVKAGSTAYLKLESTDASNTMELLFSNSTNANWQIQSVENGVSLRPLILNPSGGNVGIGTTSPTASLHVAGGGLFTSPVSFASGSNSAPGLHPSTNTNTGIYSPGTNSISIATNGVERLRVDSNGILGTFGASGQTALFVATGSAAGTTNRIFSGTFGATGIFGGAESVRIFSNGNIQNTNNSYGAISDIRLKENIVDAGSQWDDLKALRVRKYNFKEETGYTPHTQIGLIAQEVELVSPGLITETPDRDDEGSDLGTATKSVSYSVLYMKAVKALQEAMERIEVLEQRLTDAGIA